MYRLIDCLSTTRLHRTLNLYTVVSLSVVAVVERVSVHKRYSYLRKSTGLEEVYCVPLYGDKHMRLDYGCFIMGEIRCGCAVYKFILIILSKALDIWKSRHYSSPCCRISP